MASTYKALVRFNPDGTIQSRTTREDVVTKAPLESAYHYWYLFLKLSNPAIRTDKVKEDFGDLNLPFDQWYGAHGYDLFVKHPMVLRVRGSQDFKESFNSHYVLAIRKDFPKSKVAKRVRLQLDAWRWMEGFSDAESSEEPSARYVFHQRPDIGGLKAAYRCLMARKWLEERNVEYTHYLIAQKADELFATTGKERLLKVPIIETGPLADGSFERAEKKNRVGAKISRHLAKANLLIANAAIGKFPCYD